MACNSCTLHTFTVLATLTLCIVHSLLVGCFFFWFSDELQNISKESKLKMKMKWDEKKNEKESFVTLDRMSIEICNRWFDKLIES